MTDILLRLAWWYIDRHLCTSHSEPLGDLGQFRCASDKRHTGDHSTTEPGFYYHWNTPTGRR